MANLINAERVSIAYGTRTLLAGVSLGLGAVTSSSGRAQLVTGKGTLLRILTGRTQPDTGGSCKPERCRSAIWTRTTTSRRDTRCVT